jgi:hypothetical protein
MAIGVLRGEKHSFMHDLESFFWVLSWICIHSEPNGDRVHGEYEEWNYMSARKLVKNKVGVIAEKIFLETASVDFVEYNKPLIPWVDRLRKEVFQMGSSGPRIILKILGFMTE